MLFTDPNYIHPIDTTKSFSDYGLKFVILFSSSFLFIQNLSRLSITSSRIETGTCCLPNFQPTTHPSVRAAHTRRRWNALSVWTSLSHWAACGAATGAAWPVRAAWGRSSRGTWLGFATILPEQSVSTAWGRAKMAHRLKESKVIRRMRWMLRRQKKISAMTRIKSKMFLFVATTHRAWDAQIALTEASPHKKSLRRASLRENRKRRNII